jgi:hypothetical protein
MRVTAILIALTAAIDPVVTVTRSVPRRIALAVVDSPSMALPAGNGTRGETAGRIRDDLVSRLGNGFQITRSTSGAAGTVIVGDRAPVRFAPEPDARVWAVDLGEELAPNIAVTSVATAALDVSSRIRVEVHLRAVGLRGRTSAIRLMDGGLSLAERAHTWQSDREEKQVTFDIAPSRTGIVPLRIEVAADPLERAGLDNRRSFAVAVGNRRPRLLFFDARPSWSTTFMRRAAGEDRAFQVESLTRVSRGVAVGAAETAVRTLDSSTLDRFDVTIVGAPEALTRSEAAALDSFARAGGVVVLVADRHIRGPVVDLLSPHAIFTERLIEQPTAIVLRGNRPGPLASEMLVAERLPLLAEPVASVATLGVVVFKAPVGRGYVYVDGALDIWRRRDESDPRFSTFVADLLREAAADAQPPIAIRVDPGPAQVGEPVTIAVRLRDGSAAASEVAATLIGDGRREMLRLWPGSDPATFTAAFTPASEGRYGVEASSSDHVANASFLVEAGGDVTPGDPIALRLLTDGHRGAVYSPRQLGRLADDIRAAFPSTSAAATVQPMRSAWWMFPFAALLCGEWWWRRKGGRR